jgi:hypothetical protein
MRNIDESDYPKEENKHVHFQVDDTPPDVDEDVDENIHDEYFGEENFVEVPERALWKKIFDHLRCSSLFIFHRDLKFRKFLIDLVISPETLLEYRNKKKEDAIFVSLPDEPNASMKNKVRPYIKYFRKKEKKEQMEQKKATAKLSST